MPDTDTVSMTTVAPLSTVSAGGAFLGKNPRYDVCDVEGR
jgi:hypothetical protein